MERGLKCLVKPETSHFQPCRKVFIGSTNSTISSTVSFSLSLCGYKILFDSSLLSVVFVSKINFDFSACCFYNFIVLIFLDRVFCIMFLKVFVTMFVFLNFPALIHHL